MLRLIPVLIQMLSLAHFSNMFLSKTDFKLTAVLIFIDMGFSSFSKNSLLLILGLIVAPGAAFAQSAVVSNNANPSAAVSTSTTGGTNINYQTNNQWSNEQGFAPGIFCRTPTFYIGASTGQNIGDTQDSVGGGAYNYTQNYGANIGFLMPMGSSVIGDCKRLAAQIASDRETSSDLSMIRACAALDKEGIIVDSAKFPTLSKCVINPGDPPLTVARAKAMMSVNNQLQRRRQERKILSAPKIEVIKD